MSEGRDKSTIISPLFKTTELYFMYKNLTRSDIWVWPAVHLSEPMLFITHANMLCTWFFWQKKVSPCLSSPQQNQHIQYHTSTAVLITPSAPWSIHCIFPLSPSLLGVLMDRFALSRDVLDGLWKMSLEPLQSCSAVSRMSLSFYETFVFLCRLPLL